MRRILFPLLIIGVTAGLFSLGSGAFFSDVETSSGNNFDAGTLDLTPNQNDAAICTITNFAPDPKNPPTANDVSFNNGADNSCGITVTNVGSLAGDLYMTIDFTNDLENACTEPEQVAEGTSNCGGTADGQGELDNQLDLTVCSTTVTNGTEDTEKCPTGTPKLAALESVCQKVADLNATNGSYAFNFDLDSDNVDNASQGDSININLKFYLQQDNAPSPCT